MRSSYDDETLALFFDKISGVHDKQIELFTLTQERLLLLEEKVKALEEALFKLGVVSEKAS